MHIGGKHPAKMSLTDMTGFCQITNSDILHITLGNIVNRPGNHIGDFSFFLNIFFSRGTVHSCHFRK